jgi:excisionase family DNA binding protein
VIGLARFLEDDVLIDGDEPLGVDLLDEVLGRMIRLGEVCRLLGCSKSTLYKNYIRANKLKVYQLGAGRWGAWTPT